MTGAGVVALVLGALFAEAAETTWTPPAWLTRWAITSLAFMLELVPDPVWKMSIGK